MIERIAEAAEAGLGRTPTRWCLALVTVGAMALVVGAAAGRADDALGALQVGWLFLAGLAAGAVALAAAVRLSHGRWADDLLPVAEAGARFFGPALLLLIAVEGARGLGGGPGSTRALRPAVTLVGGLLVAGAGARFVALARQRGAPPWRTRGAGAAYLVAYAVGLSAWAWAGAPDLARQPAFTVVPPLFFMGAFLSGVAGVALVAALRGPGGPEARHDLATLLFGLGVFWGYLAWSLVLPTWYANVPDEAAALLARGRGAAGPLAGAVLALVLVLPCALLLAGPWKRRRGPLATAAASLLVGLWAERFLLFRPPSAPLDPWSLLVGGGVTAGLAGLFLLSVGGGLVPAPPPLEPPGATTT
jgi:hypothetical protein